MAEGRQPKRKLAESALTPDPLPVESSSAEELESPGIGSLREVENHERKRAGSKENKAGFEAERMSEGPTLEEVETFIEEAREDAAKFQGSGLPLAGARSQHQFHQQIVDVFHRFQSKGQKEPLLCHLGELIWDVLSLVYVEDDAGRRLKPMAGKKNLFPLSASGFQVNPSGERSFLHAVLASLNSLHGVALSGPDNSVMQSAVKRMEALVRGSTILHEPLPQLKFDEFWKYKGLDYEGEEIRLAKAIKWESIEPSLPKEVGMLDIRDFCSGGVLHYINNFTDYLVSPAEMHFGKPPRVMVENGEWEKVTSGLLERGLCTLLPKSKLFHCKDTPLLSGLFSVSKQEWIGDIEICRLIMNLRPLNSICLGLTGDTPTLPSITNMGALFLDDDEALCISSEDARCLFYLFSVPEAWFPWGNLLSHPMRWMKIISYVLEFFQWDF